MADLKADVALAFKTCNEQGVRICELEAIIERLSASVSNDEWEYASTFYDGTDHDYDTEAMERDNLDALIAARANAPQPEDGK